MDEQSLLVPNKGIMPPYWDRRKISPELLEHATQSVITVRTQIKPL